MRASRLLGIVVATTLFATVTCGSVAGAANLGPQSPKTLGAWVIPGGAGAPNVITWANFNGVTGTNLNGKALNGPGTWIVDGGTWTIQTNNTVSTNVAIANMDVNVGTQNAATLATLTLGATANAGLVVLDNGTVAVYALYSKAAGGTITLYKYAGGPVVLGTVTGVGTPASALMKLDATTTTMKVSFAGTLVLSYTLTAAEITTLKTAANSRFGLIADSDGVTRFDDFHVDN
jgi:hypothetical protein